ncbi:MAG TPA: hypothetical protein VII74_06850, partial [Chthoniobacterales bacterium]
SFHRDDETKLEANEQVNSCLFCGNFVADHARDGAGFAPRPANGRQLIGQSSFVLDDAGECPRRLSKDR